MCSYAIRCKNIGKQYQIGERVSYAPMLRDVIAKAVTAPARLFTRSGKNGGSSSRERDRIWALRDVSLDIREGEVTGLIGRNGAGKSTLLKILSRVTRPTTGSATIHGRMGSLLEVGTGFHYELTGRENCYLSGAILGMSKREIDRKYDEIVAFAEVEKFIDTPIKHYSSGMLMRLGFAVAAHLDPEILLVDEVLAVGDAGFQKKCFGKIGEVSRNGRTIILVSHNMAAINALCQRCVILNAGRIEFDGSTDKATAQYYAESLNIDSSADLSARSRAGDGRARFTSLLVYPQDAAGREQSAPYPGCDLRIQIEIRCDSRISHSNLSLIFYDSSGYRLIDTNTAQKGHFLHLEAGQNAVATFLLRDVCLTPGKYLLGLWLGREGIETVDYIEFASTLEFVEGDESRAHPVLYPGRYLCRFEESVAISEGPLVTTIATTSSTS